MNSQPTRDGIRRTLRRSVRQPINESVDEEQVSMITSLIMPAKGTALFPSSRTRLLVYLDVRASQESNRNFSHFWRRDSIAKTYVLTDRHLTLQMAKTVWSTTAGQRIRPAR